MNRLVKNRERAFKAQNGRCYYCQCAMWRPDERDIFCKHFALTKRQARGLQCTAEHVIARCDGGTDAAINIVAACARCNFLRHARKRALPSPCFKDHVTKRIQLGGWHVLNVVRAGLRDTFQSRAP